MSMHSRVLKFVFVVFLFVQPAPTVVAEEIKLEHAGLMLNANLVAAQDDWQDGTVVLITHGTLAHNGMEIISTLQSLLAEQGLTSIAPNLSLGLNDRRSAYDCEVPHRHRHTDALDEIGAWVDWLKTKGVKDLMLLGHSRGGNQAAWFALERLEPVVKGVVLVAPLTWSEAYATSDYKKRFATELDPVLKRAEALAAAGKGDEWMEDTGFIYCPKTKVQAQSFLSYHAPEPRLDTPSLLDDVKVPVLVIAGTED
jgi:pimeloyl-ACP methyl ester carboxylesterase